MKRILLILSFFYCSLSPLNAQNDLFKGSWDGKLNVGTMNLRLVFHISYDDTVVSAKFDSPDQGAKGLVFDKVECKERNISLKFSLNGAQYEGVLGESNQTIEGNWIQAGQKIPLVMKRVSLVEKSVKPQEPIPPFTYDVENVTFKSRDKEIVLAGTLTKPKGNGLYPAIILISGSGPQNRDEEILGHKPFAVIADYFTKKGWAVLRYDDRGVGESKGDFSTATTTNFTQDASGAVDFLRSRKDIKKDKIGICGHSEGGIVAQQLSANAKNNIAFVVMLAGPSIIGADILASQNKAILESAGVDTALASWYSRYLRNEVYAGIMNNKPKDEVAKTLAEALDRMFTTFTTEELNTLGINPTVTKAMMVQLLTPWMREFLQYNPTDNLRTIQCPLLALYGENDKQVLSGINSAVLRKHNPKAEVIVIPGLNHLFQTSQNGMPMEYGTLEETFSPKALTHIEEWLKKNIVQ